MKSLEQRVTEIERRNKRVELDKAWEQSLVRKAAIAILTYTLVGFYLTYLGAIHPWLSAIVPVMGFVLSTLALSVIRAFWER